MAEAVDVLMGHALVPVLLALPWDQIVQQLEYALVADVLGLL